MTPHKQLFRHDPANGLTGDCYRTCIASLLDMEPATVPHFVELYEREPSGPSCDDLVREWLRPHGMALIDFGWQCENPIEDVLDWLKRIAGEGVHFMLVGASPRGTCHVVIATTDGIVHDPHPDGGGLVGPHDGFWSVTFIGLAL